MSGLEKPVGWNKPTHSRSSSTASSRLSRQNIKDWELMDDIQTDMVFGGDPLQEVTVPGICEGYLMKKRKWPLKGWHKRYFVLDKGVLRYAKTQQDITKGKLHGSLDVSLAVMAINKKSKRIDLDTGDSLYHIKAKNQDLLYIWVTKLCVHRMYKRNEATRMHNDFLQALSQGNSLLPHTTSLEQRNGAIADIASYSSYQSDAALCQGDLMPQVEKLPSTATGVNSKVSAWLQQTQQADCCFHELSRCQADLTELNRLVQKLHSLEGNQSSTNGDLQRFISIQNLSLEKPKKKSGKMWSHSRTLSRLEIFGMVRITSSYHLNNSSNLGTSVPSIPDYVSSQLTSPSFTSPEGKKIQQDICNVSQRVHESLKSVHEALAQERQRLQDAWTNPNLHQSTSQQLANLCTTLPEVKIDSYTPFPSCCNLCEMHPWFLSHTFCPHLLALQPKLSTPGRAPSVADSTYYDASDDILCGTSSENEAFDELGLSDATSTNSDLDDGHKSRLNYACLIVLHFPLSAAAAFDYCTRSGAGDLLNMASKRTGHRTALPAPCPDNSHIGLMTILYNNIGKDLSRVSMPAPLNEPICLLQRLCEELEYSELLDTANRTEDPYERMVYISAFAISGYATARYRSRYKPFNPVLGETFECDHEDKGFRFISEQVSHHPPVSACHADSENFSFWQDQRWKNKFWGKSLEIMPTGMINVTLRRFGDHYEWNKVVTCIHNVLSQQRYLEHYGEVVIRNLKSSVCTSKITFTKSRYWGSDNNMNEVQGVILDERGTVVHRFGGFWHEGIYCNTLPTPQCVWKPNPQPADHFIYYGFSSFAMELNELTPELKALLPPTDTRLRPDQRMLEEGKVNEADKRKDEVEEKQRERRKLLAKKGEEHVPRFFRKSLDATGREVAGKSSVEPGCCANSGHTPADGAHITKTSQLAPDVSHQCQVAKVSEELFHNACVLIWDSCRKCQLTCLTLLIASVLVTLSR
ncbi:oxysterol-binding protein-related protein 7 [Arapaima gigas]